MNNAKFDVTGIGNAIVDVLTEADDAFLEARDMVKGSMRLIDAARADELYRDMSAAIEQSGGSVANSMAGIASLGGTGAYIGKVRNDALGKSFTTDMRQVGIRFDTEPLTSGPGTARCLIFVSKDAQRTMNTYLGASVELTPNDVDAAVIQASAVTYLEGYLYDPPQAKQAFVKAAQIAHAAGREVCLSLSDAFCVARHREEFLALVRDHIDILFANEQEITSLYQCSFDEAVGHVRGKCRIAILTRSSHGSLLVTDEQALAIAAEPVQRVLDTTGAGDLYAAGFLFGYTRGRPLGECGRLGSLAAAEVIAHFGARPECDLREWVESKL
jgi:sugar/nucleoside kinase (ribokinase family)